MAQSRFPPVPEGWDWTALYAVALREARAVLRDEHAAQDAAQEAVLRAWRHSARCRSPDSPEAWVRTIARREALRLTQRDGELSSEQASLDAGETGVEAIGARIDVRRAVGRLGDGERVVIEQHYFNDLSCAQIADALELPLGTVKIRLYRARHRLREHL